MIVISNALEIKQGTQKNTLTDRTVEVTTELQNEEQCFSWLLTYFAFLNVKCFSCLYGMLNGHFG